jgi:hypothetical protein
VSGDQASGGQGEAPEGSSAASASVDAPSKRQTCSSKEGASAPTDSTTRTLDAALWTRNITHFPMIVGLTPPYRPRERVGAPGRGGGAAR